MKNKKIKIAIIGAGPSGIAAAMPFLKYEDNFEVTNTYRVGAGQ